MGTLNKFLGSPKEVDIHGDKIVLHPLKVKDLEKFTKINPTPEESKEISKQIIMLSIPGTTSEEVDELPMEQFTLILKEINKLNGFEDERADELKKRLKQNQ